MGPIYSSRPAPKTHFTDDPRGYAGPAICGEARPYGQPYVTDLEYRVDCGRCNRILDNRAEKAWDAAAAEEAEKGETQ